LNLLPGATSEKTRARKVGAGVRPGLRRKKKRGREPPQPPLNLPKSGKTPDTKGGKKKVLINLKTAGSSLTELVQDRADPPFPRRNGMKKSGVQTAIFPKSFPKSIQEREGGQWKQKKDSEKC